jgi:hypothetical protein
MLTPVKGEMLAQKDLLHEARRFRTILKGFDRNVELLFHGTGLVPHVDHAALATAFASWRQGFDASKHLADNNRGDFVIYAAGLMLRELLAAGPLTLKSGEQPMGAKGPITQWPEGYAYVSFCISVASAILQDMGEKVSFDEKLADNATFWNTFRENVSDNSSAAVGFFDLLCGIEPNWNGPDVPWFRRALRGKLLPADRPLSS